MKRTFCLKSAQYFYALLVLCMLMHSSLKATPRRPIEGYVSPSLQHASAQAVNASGLMTTCWHTWDQSDACTNGHRTEAQKADLAHVFPAWVYIASGLPLAPLHPSLPDGDDVVVTVTPLSAWQSQYPGCTLSAQADDCGATPEVFFSGGNCYPSTGTMNIGRVDVVHAPTSCHYAYMVQSVDGGIYIVIIDPE